MFAKDSKSWEEYYYKNVRLKDHLVDLGRKLHTKITEVLQAEIETVKPMKNRVF